ncbi:MAG: prenyltransferase [Marmoricola sp.]
MTRSHPIPAVPGVLTSAQVAVTAASIVAMQEPDGAVPWTIGEHVDVWNHVEAAMALMVAGETEAAEAAYAWCARNQRTDGSWPMKLVAGEVEDASGETNMSAYLAVGVWHHWLLRRDLVFVEQMWPVVRRGLDYVIGMQLPFGGIAWSQEWDDHGPAAVNTDALLAGSSSIYQSLRAGVVLADLMADPQPEWELAGGRLGHALREHRDLFLDKSTFSMDWYYPVLGGAVRGSAGLALIATRWDDFVIPGLGARCVDTNPWVTGAETCELAMALDSLDDHERALQVFTDMQHLRHENGSYWTGFVVGDEVFWPHEQTTYTAAAVILAADELGRTSPASGIMRGDTLAEHFREIGLECGCADEADASADLLSGRT